MVTVIGRDLIQPSTLTAVLAPHSSCTRPMRYRRPELDGVGREGGHGRGEGGSVNVRGDKTTALKTLLVSD